MQNVAAHDDRHQSEFDAERLERRFLKAMPVTTPGRAIEDQQEADRLPAEERVALNRHRGERPEDDGYGCRACRCQDRGHEGSDSRVLEGLAEPTSVRPGGGQAMEGAC